jgi:hypothetical protein
MNLRAKFYSKYIVKGVKEQKMQTSSEKNLKWLYNFKYFFKFLKSFTGYKLQIKATNAKLFCTIHLNFLYNSQKKSKNQYKKIL